jgi:hypothetical protein
LPHEPAPSLAKLVLRVFQPYYIGCYLSANSHRNASGGCTVKTMNLKRIAAVGAISAALSSVALGLGAGGANADDNDGNAPFPPGGISGDWQSYFPLLLNGGAANSGNLENPGVGQFFRGLLGGQG